MGAPRYGISLRVEHEKRIARCIGAKAQDGKMRWNNTKTNNGRNFQYKKFSIIDLVLADRRTLSGTRSKSACGISTSCPFSFSALRSAITKANEYVTIGFTFRILVFFPLLGKFKRHSLRAIRIFQCFSSHIPKDKFREMTLNWEWWRLYRSFVSLTERRERRVTCPQLICDIKQTRKNTIFFKV